jgi:hypothetical protein
MMSVILECQPGDEFVCIQEFHASPEGEGFSWTTSRHFQVGERLRYVGCAQDAYFGNRPNGWLVRFDAGDGKRYAATQTNFITEECWQSLEKFFRAHVLRTSGNQPQVMETR